MTKKPGMIAVGIRAAWLALLLLLAAIAPISAQAAAGAPFFIFLSAKFPTADEEAQVFKVLAARARSGDYLGRVLVERVPALSHRVDRSHILVAPASIAGVTNNLACGPSTPGIILYDPEHWDATPNIEKSDLPDAIDQAKAAVAASKCHSFALAPDGRFAGVDPRACHWALQDSIFRNMHSTANGIALVNIQGHILFGNSCVKRFGEDNSLASYIAFNTAVANQIRAKIPGALVTTQLSLRAMSPQRILQAIKALTGIVDGFYVAYPASEGSPCRFCTPANLETVLAAIHP